MSRRQLWELPVNYAAVGATQSPEIVGFPPRGFRSYERRVRIGTGPARWDFAWHAALGWGIPIRSGFTVELTETPREVREGSYSPVEFDAHGTPIAPAVTGEPAETVYGPDGFPLGTPGDSVWLVWQWGALKLRFPVRVIFVIDEADRKGIALGTLPGHPLTGEEAFFVEHEEDGSVWLTLRSLTGPAEGWWRLATPALSIAQRVLRSRYLKALSGPVD